MTSIFEYMASQLPVTDPTWIFFLVLCIVLFAPIVFNKLRIPHLIGMILAGILVGEHGLGLLERDSSFEIFGKVGLYYIMFLASLELEAEGLKRNLWRCLAFGVLTFSIPFAAGMVMGLWIFDYSMLASALIACVLASHTLVSYPIVCRMGLAKHPWVVMSVGGTVFSLFLSLIILGGIAGVVQKGGDWLFVLLFLVKCVGYCTVVFLVIPRVTRLFFMREPDNVLQYTYVLSVVFLCAASAGLAGLDGLFGAFLSGLVLNRYVPRTSPLMNRIEFVGNALFIPYFLIGVGMIININILFGNLRTLKMVAVLVFVAVISKWLAAWLTSKFLKLNHGSQRMLFGLSVAHAAGALAMVMVGTNLEIAPGVMLMDDEVLNGVVMVILFSCIISGLVTEKSAQQLVLAEKREDPRAADDEKILIPLSNPDGLEDLVKMAMLMHNRALNRGLVALNVVLDDEHSERNREQGQKLLEKAVETAASADVRMQTHVRVSTNVTTGIVHSVKEYSASEVVIGMHHKRSINDSFFGTLTRRLTRGLFCQVTIVRSMVPLNTLKMINVVVPPKAQYETGFYRWVKRISRMADRLGCRIHFYGSQDTLTLIERHLQVHYENIRAEYTVLDEWVDFLLLAPEMTKEKMLVVVTTRKNAVSYQSVLDDLPNMLSRSFAQCSLVIIYPDQFSEDADEMTFLEPRQQYDRSFYDWMIKGLTRWLKRGVVYD